MVGGRSFVMKRDGIFFYDAVFSKRSVISEKENEREEVNLFFFSRSSIYRNRRVSRRQVICLTSSVLILFGGMEIIFLALPFWEKGVRGDRG